MKVYVCLKVYEDLYDSEVLGVFSSREWATEFALSVPEVCTENPFVMAVRVLEFVLDDALGAREL